MIVHANAQIVSRFRPAEIGVHGVLVGRLGLRADQRVRSAFAAGDVGRIQFPAIDDLVQVSPSLLGQGKSERLYVGVIEEAAEFFAVGCGIPSLSPAASRRVPAEDGPCGFPTRRKWTSTNEAARGKRA